MRRAPFTPEQALARHTTVLCAWCPKWKVTGTLEETNEKAREHRAKHHPEAQPKRHPKRQRKMPQLSDKTVQENIAAVRVQGGAIWVREGDL